MDPALTGRLSRRRLLGGVAGLGIINAAGVGLAGCASDAATTPNQIVAFQGAHQAGITTDIQDRLAFAAFEGTFALYLQRRLGWDARSAAFAFAGLGLLSALVQGGLIRRLVPATGEAS